MGGISISECKIEKIDCSKGQDIIKLKDINMYEIKGDSRVENIIGIGGDSVMNGIYRGEIRIKVTSNDNDGKKIKI